VETPEFLRHVLGYAAYLPPGPFDDVFSGELFITPPPDESGLTDHSFAAIPCITAHEGYPGHHLQLSTITGLGSVVRRLPVSTLMIEGWGLYVEELMAEVDYYSPDARLAQLALSQLRAARIVVDVSIHCEGVTAEDAAALLVERAGISEVTARSESTRYTMSPGQPCTYLLGAEEIRRIRSSLVATDGATSLRTFHDDLLSYGNLHPSLAGQAMQRSG
jgi:uncharacterized protein (DUF885 family)